MVILGQPQQRKTTNGTLSTYDTISAGVHQQQRIHELFLNADRLGPACTQGGKWFHRAIESG